MHKCPKCGSTRLVTELDPYVPVECLDCGHQVVNAGAANSTLMEQAIQSVLQEQDDLPSLGEQMNPLQETEQEEED